MAATHGHDKRLAFHCRNLIGQLLNGPRVKRMLADDGEVIAADLVARLRASRARWPVGRAIDETIRKLTGDALFDDCWRRPYVGVPAGNFVTYRSPAGRRNPLPAQHMAFYPRDAQHLWLIRAETRQRLRRLRGFDSQYPH
ncbi:hypothetical protein [Rhodococcus sp. IEGM1428]|uniref:MmyB family transcriptional regulator n=1 Tax=Rhodococcus sp. IEGM1428 TaxID=3392191 RepID=UPI003D1137F3